MKNKIEQEKTQSYHFVIVGYGDFNKIVQKLNNNLKFYRLENQGSFKSKEIIYDLENNLLSDAGIVISKLYQDKKTMLSVRKLSTLPGQLKRPSKKFILGELDAQKEPKDISLEIAQAIESSFVTNFTVDLDAFVKQTIAKIEIDIEARAYRIIGGNGYRAKIFFEKALYKDIKSGKKVSGQGVTLELVAGEENEEGNKELLSVIDEKVLDLVRYDLSRFEIAKKLLYPVQEEDVANLPEDED